ncbi:MAG: transposase [Acidobacteria bacterium]|nr:transposase [Acidobacteriota bacterium]
MPKRQLALTGGVVMHVFNRGARRARIFESHQDYEAFIDILSETSRRFPLRLLAYCVMPNHWHLVVWAHI